MSSVTLNRENLKKLIEPHFFNDLFDTSYKLEKIKSSKLLTYNRFDLSFKLLFLKMIEKDDNFSMDIYREHIKAFSLGEFNEPGNAMKISFDDYQKTFVNIFYDIRKNGFDKNLSVIPLSKNGSIANGSHRVACSIILDKEIDCVRIDTPDHLYDFNFFRERGVSKTVMDAAACEFVKNSKNIYLAIIWPSAEGKDNQINQIIKNIVYEKRVTLNKNGAHNLLSQIYYGEDWIGSLEDNFKGSYGKLIECFKVLGPIRFIAFQSENIREVREIKDKIRSLFNIGKHSIHITDNHTESLRISRIAFNENSIHFLNYAKPNKYLSTHQKIKDYKSFLDKNDISFDDAILDSGIILSLYGLREAQDIDFLINDNVNLKIQNDLIDMHDEVLKYYKHNKMNLIYDQSRYFYFNDIKFVSFSDLYKMKLNRNEIKDRIDSKLMEALIENNFFKENFSRLMQNFFYGKIKLRHNFLKALKYLGLYNLLKRIYKSFGLEK